MTKEEARQSLFNTKMYVNGKSKEIQENLFELGFKWASGSDKVGYTEKPFLYLDGYGMIANGDDMIFYKGHEYHEVSEDYILNLKWDEEVPISKSFFDQMINYPYIIIQGRNIKTEIENQNDKQDEEEIMSDKYKERIRYAFMSDEQTRFMKELNERAKTFYKEIENPNDKWEWVREPKTASELNTFDKCLVCNGKGCVWVPEIYGYKLDEGKHYLIGHCVSSRHVIPYDESLIGKLYNHEDEK